MARFEELAARGGCWMDGDAGRFLTDGAVYSIPRVRFRSAVNGAALKIGIFTGIRGNLEGGVALLHFLESVREQPWRAAGFDLSIYPLCNPTGHEDGRATTRRNAELHGGFWQGSAEPEIMLLENELREQRFQAVITLYTALGTEGFSGSARGGATADHLLESGLKFGALALGRPVTQQPWPQGAISAPENGSARGISLRFGAPRDISMRLRVAALDASLGAVLASARHYLLPQ